MIYTSIDIPYNTSGNPFNWNY